MAGTWLVPVVYHEQINSSFIPLLEIYIKAIGLDYYHNVRRIGIICRETSHLNSYASDGFSE